MLQAKPMLCRGPQAVSVRRSGDRLIIGTVRESADPSVKGLIELMPVSERIVRVRFTEKESFSGRLSPSLLIREPFQDWQYGESAEGISLETTALRLEISRSGCAFHWKEIGGGTIVREPEGGGKILSPVMIRKMAHSSGAELRVEATVDGPKQRAGDGRWEDLRSGFSWSLRLAFRDNEAIYGLGQHEDGILDYRFRSQDLYQTNRKVALPTIVSSRGYAVHSDTHSLSTFRGDAGGGEFWVETADQMDWFFVYGPSFDAIVSGLRFLTGDLPMHPRWAYGFIQSRERYETQEEILGTAERFRAERVPLDCLVLDWNSWPDGLWGQKTLDPVRFPDPDAMMRDLHERGVRLMVSIWPHLSGNGPNRTELEKSGCLLPNGGTYDAFREEARAMYWKQAKEGLFDHGVDAWWCDCTEPFEADWNGSVKLPDWKRMLVNTDESKKYIEPDLINAYSLYHTRGIYEGQRAATDEKRVVILTRSAGPSQQRYGAVTWSGDIEASWSRMRKQIVDGLNFTVTGNPRWSLDIGGFFVKPGVPWFWDGRFPEGAEDPGYRELYLRWIQWGVFLPMFRSHGTDVNREIWNFGSSGDRIYDILKEFTELRYRLLPYIYSCAAAEVFDRYTMMRMLAFDFAEDAEAIRVEDQYMFGPAFMVCPVTFPMEWAPGGKPLPGGPKIRRVYLPSGTDWFDFWTGARFGGGVWIDADAPLERIPLFVRAGSIIPLGPVVRHSGEASDAAWEIMIYSGQDAVFRIYEDAGDGYAYERGEYCRTDLIWDDAGRKFRIGEQRGDYSGRRKNREMNPLVVDGEQKNRYDS